MFDNILFQNILICGLGTGIGYLSRQNTNTNTNMNTNNIDKMLQNIADSNTNLNKLILDLTEKKIKLMD